MWKLKNRLASWHTNHRMQIIQGSAATDWRRGDRFYYSLFAVPLRMQK